jgi:hypothetical protein
MAIITLRAWYIPEYEPLRSISQRPHDLRLAKNSLLKSALRADFLDESQVVKDSEWFQRYLGGESVEFYVEGSGSYVISNIDLISHEIYFTKQDHLSQLEPTIFLSYQNLKPTSSDLMRGALETAIAKINPKSRIQLTLEQSHRLAVDEPIKLKSALMSRLKRSLLFVADVTPVAEIMSNDILHLVPAPQVCVEVGYAIQAKRPEQILLVQVQEHSSQGVFPFDLPIFQRLIVSDVKELTRQLPEAIALHLQRYNLFS